VCWRPQGLRSKTLRYYEEWGLLPAIGRRQGAIACSPRQLAASGVHSPSSRPLLSLEENSRDRLAFMTPVNLPLRDICDPLGRQIERDRFGQIKEAAGRFAQETAVCWRGCRSHPAREAELICPNLQGCERTRLTFLRFNGDWQQALFQPPLATYLITGAKPRQRPGYCRQLQGPR